MAVSDFLLQSQQNQIFQEIRGAGLDPRDFNWGENRYGREAFKAAQRRSGAIAIPDDWVILQYGRTGYSFAVNARLGKTRFSPGETKVREVHEALRGWDHVMVNLRQWLQNLRREIETPDLWASLQQEKELVEASVSETEDNRPFTPAEQERIAASLREIRDYVLKSGAYTAEQLGIVNARLDYLEAAATRMGRKDWILATVGALTSTVMTEALTSGTARDLFRVVGEALRWMFRGQGLLQ